jgi:hypothetical protein
MPTGTTKIALFGVKVPVPGGSQTFNTSGTFSVHVGVITVNATCKGGTGNAGGTGNNSEW